MSLTNMLVKSIDWLQVVWGQSLVYAQMIAFSLIPAKNVQMLSLSYWQIDKKSERLTLIATGLTASLLIALNT